jgi:sn-glycerol 3-phosphate transport system ATP-binding protein
VEHLGADSIVLCEIDGQPISVRLDGFSKVLPGEDIRIAWDGAHEHRFDPNSEVRLDEVVQDGRRAASER